jgi:hypothetical protein
MVNVTIGGVLRLRKNWNDAGVVTQAGFPLLNSPSSKEVTPLLFNMHSHIEQAAPI